MKIRQNTWDATVIESVLIRNEYGLPSSMQGAVVLDIGAHIGAFAVACQKRGARRVICYEPDPENMNLLSINADEDIDSRTETILVQAAVLGEGVPAGSLGVRRLTNHDYDVGRNTGHVDVFGEPDGTEAIGINDVIASVGEFIDVLKMDCEGSEWSIFDKADFVKVRAITAELHALPETDHPSLSVFKGQTLTQLAESAVKKLRKSGFETSVIYHGSEMAHLTAAKTATVNVGTDRQKRLLWIGDAHLTTGYAKVTENVCRRLVQRGWDVRVLGIGYNGDPHSYPYKVYPAVDANVGGARNGVSRLKEIITRIKPDIAVIQDDSWNVGIVVDHMALLNCMVPTVGYVAVDSENVREDTVALLRNLRHVICHTQYGIDQLKLAGFTGPASIAAHAVDTDLYTIYNKAESREGIPKVDRMPEAFLFGSVAVNQQRKRLDLTLAYFAKWWKQAGRPENAFLYMHTNENGVWDLKQLASYLDIRGRLIVSYSGSQTMLENQMPTLYTAFDVMISTAGGESFGLPLLESMACGIPNIAVRCGGAPDWAGDSIYWVQPSQYSFTANRTNTKWWSASETDFVNAMQDMYSSKDMRGEYIKRGLAKAQQMNSWDTIADHFDKTLNSILSVQRIAKTSSALEEFS